MLNISHDKLNKKVSLKSYKAHQRAFTGKYYNLFNKLLGLFLILVFILLFLPWTQNVSGNGFVTTLTLDQRPQTIQSPIPGRIERWYVKEGDLVKKGDTIVFISELKNEYQDPNLLERTRAQQQAKSESVISYQGKITALENQVAALQKEKVIKVSQAKNKLNELKLEIQSDSIQLIALKNNLNIAQEQYKRTASLFNEGIKSKTDLELKKLKMQELEAKMISKENKVLANKNKLSNATIEINRVIVAYDDKIAKSESSKYTAISDQNEAKAQVAKLENQSTNYEIRSGLYYITAPQDGIINKAIRSGIGENFKAGEPLVGIMPANYALAVETYVSPIDLQLLHIGEKVRIQFDGWPAIFFSGWPNTSFGTFAGKIIAIENFISSNGKFRVLIEPDPEEEAWPDRIRIGSGAYTIALLEEVPIWYELWRKLNGFPPNYYEVRTAEASKTKK